ncbi:MAG TPA: UDP-2,3-diacylglucosamine diphosphatase [Phnomibacter sp.]|nr:UDP-2,3-diacylglucosamine diphosphatase [Phnomibacter sp.]
MELNAGKKIYFFSDVHLGAPDADASLLREKKLVRFLEKIRQDAQEIVIVGDLFDFWYEYRHVVPKGYVRLLGKLAQLTDAGIRIHFFVGNHDMWMKTYFQRELNIPVYFHPQSFTYGPARFYVAHGDGLGPGDHGYKLLKKIFRNPVCQWLFGMLPATIGIGLANYFSSKSRASVAEHEKTFLGPDKEWLMIHSREVLKQEHFDYFVYGHRHVAVVHPLGDSSTYVNLGDWVTHFTYGVWDGSEMLLKKFEEPTGEKHSE